MYGYYDGPLTREHCIRAVTLTDAAVFYEFRTCSEPSFVSSATDTTKNTPNTISRIHLFQVSPRKLPTTAPNGEWSTENQTLPCRKNAKKTYVVAKPLSDKQIYYKQFPAYCVLRSSVSLASCPSHL